MTALAALQVDSPLSYLAFEDKPWAGLLLAFGASITISALIEVIRRLWGRRSAARAAAAAAQASAEARTGTGAPGAQAAMPTAQAAAHSCASPPHDGASRAPVP